MSGETPSPRDPALEAFLEAIETALRSRRGVDHALSPREFAIARGWYDAGVPLATVLVAIGLLVVHAKALIDRLVPSKRTLEILPVVSAGLVTVIGIVVIVQALIETG